MFRAAIWRRPLQERKSYPGRVREEPLYGEFQVCGVGLQRDLKAYCTLPPVKFPHEDDVGAPRSELRRQRNSSHESLGLEQSCHQHHPCHARIDPRLYPRRIHGRDSPQSRAHRHEPKDLPLHCLFAPPSDGFPVGVSMRHQVDKSQNLKYLEAWAGSRFVPKAKDLPLHCLFAPLDGFPAEISTRRQVDKSQNLKYSEAWAGSRFVPNRDSGLSLFRPIAKVGPGWMVDRSAVDAPPLHRSRPFARVQLSPLPAQIPPQTFPGA